VADWISIITGQFSFVSIVSSQTGWLPRAVANNADSYEKRVAVAMILTTVQWVFLFSLLIRYFKIQARLKSDLGCLWSVMSGVGGLGLFIAFELVILNAVVFPISRMSLVFWLGIPATAWVSFGLLGLLIVQVNEGKVGVHPRFSRQDRVSQMATSRAERSATNGPEATISVPSRAPKKHYQ
jgi:hypothetical protein